MCVHDNISYSYVCVCLCVCAHVRTFVHTCSKLTSVRRPMAGNSPSGLTFFEKITIASALMADTILDINMKIETVGPVG